MKNREIGKLQITEVASLYEETLSQLSKDWNNWVSFLQTASRVYKYDYQDQVMIFTQRPDATACAEYDMWNKTMGRYVRRGSKGIALLDDSGDRICIRYVFDVSDTGTRKHSRTPWLWKMEEQYKEPVSAMLERSYGVSGDDLAQQLIDVAEKLANEYWEENQKDVRYIVDGSMLEEYDDINLKNQFSLAATTSIAYALMFRCGLDTERYFQHEDFIPVLDFTTPATIGALGTAVSQINQRVLRQIEVTIKNYERKQITERSSIHGEQFNLHEERRLLDSKPEPERTAGEAPRQVWQNAESVPEGTPALDLQSAVADREAVPAPAGDRRDGKQPSGADDAPARESSGRNRRTESQRPDEMGWTDEQLQIPGRRDHSGRAGIRLINDESEVEQISLFPSEQEQIRIVDEEAEVGHPISAFGFSQDEIDNVLRLGGNTERHRECIVAAFEEQQSTAEIAAYLREIYIGGNGIGSITAWYAEDGIHLSNGKTARYDKAAQVISWESAAERIGQLLQDGQFATNVELAEAEGYERSSLAEKLWHLYHDFSDNAREAGYLKSLAKNPGHGFPEESEWLTAQLRNPEFRRTLAEEYTVFWMAYRQDRKLLRFHYHSLEEIDKTLKGLSLPRITFSSALTEIPAVKQFITEDEINDSLSNGSSVSGGKGRIFSFFQENHTDKEKADFLKHEYGIGGHSHALSRAGNSWEGHDGKGLEYRKDGCQDVRISWEKVSRRITDLINRGRYLTEQEQAEYSRIQEEKALAEEEIVNVSQEKAVSDVEYDLGYGHLGNGITVWNRLEEEFGDYKNVAHISPDRTVTFYDERLPENLRDEIQHVAATSTMTVSATQDIPVFSVPPMEREIQPTRMVRDIFASYLPIICEKLREDKDYQNACQFSDKENAVSEGKKAIKRIVSTIEDQDFRQIYYGNDRFHIDLNREVLDNTYRELSQNQQLETETRSGSESMEPYQHNYRLLSRLRMDCEYYLGYGNRADKNLWAGNVPDQIAKMRELYQTLPEKPDWISLDDIDRYEREMSRNTEPQYLPDSDPYIVCNWSENSIFEDGKRYSIKEFDTLMKEADEERVAGAKAAMEKYGTWQKWYEADDPEAAKFLGYDKTKFTVVMPTGETYTERQDIGDGDGGVIDFLSQYPAYKNIVPILQQAAMQPEPENFSEKENTSEIETQTVKDEILTELQKKALEIAGRYKDLPLQAKIDVIAQAFGCKTGKIHTSPCSGKWRGTSDMTIHFDNGASLFIGNCLTPKSQNG